MKNKNPYYNLALAIFLEVSYNRAKMALGNPPGADFDMLQYQIRQDLAENQTLLTAFYVWNEEKDPWTYG